MLWKNGATSILIIWIYLRHEICTFGRNILGICCIIKSEWRGAHKSCHHSAWHSFGCVIQKLHNCLLCFHAQAKEYAIYFRL